MKFIGRDHQRLLEKWQHLNEYFYYDYRNNITFDEYGTQNSAIKELIDEYYRREAVENANFI